MKKKFYPNGKLNAIFTMEENNKLANRIKLAKPSINSSSPKTYNIFNKNASKNKEKDITSKNIIYNFYI